jgi:hypothetical protein
MNFMSLGAAVVIAGGSGGLIHSLLVLIIVGVVLGLFYYLVTIAPFIPAAFKQILTWLIILFGVLILVNVLLGLIGHPFISW